MKEIRKRKPTITDHLVAHLYSLLVTHGAIDISPKMEIGFCVSRRRLLKAAKRLCEDPIDFEKIFIVRIEGTTLLVSNDFSLSDFDQRYIPITKEEINAYYSRCNNAGPDRCAGNKHRDLAKN